MYIYKVPNFQAIYSNMYIHEIINIKIKWLMIRNLKYYNGRKCVSTHGLIRLLVISIINAKTSIIINIVLLLLLLRLSILSYSLNKITRFVILRKIYPVCKLSFSK